MTGARPLRVLIAKPGLDGHDRGAKVVAHALRDAGIEVVYSGLKRTPEELVAEAVQEDVDVIGLSVLSGAHLTLSGRLLARLREADADDVAVVVGGTIPAGDAAKGYVAAGFNLPGTNFPVMQDVLKHVYKKGKGDLEDMSRVGSIYHTRGVVAGIITAEAIRNAQNRFGKGKPITGEQMRWGIENLNIDEKRLKELGATGLMQPLKVSCMDHEGGGAVKFLQWDGRKWITVSDWIASDQSLVRPMIEASAAQYAKEKGITPRDCSKEK